jgi:UDP-N-acetylmuramate dehydrogenase
MKDVTAEVTLLDRSGSVRTVPAAEMDFSYRHSILMETGEIVLSARFRLRRGDRTEIRRTMDELLEKRRSKQPLEYPSAGSTWKRPEGYFAAKLIEEAGCKGLSVGDAQISEKHAGFLINKGHATAAQIRSLMREVERRVYESSGVRLTPEVELIGEWEEETES